VVSPFSGLCIVPRGINSFEYVTLSAKANPDPSAAAGILGFFVLYFLGLTALYTFLALSFSARFFRMCL
jgi:hypothetical protein